MNEISAFVLILAGIVVVYLMTRPRERRQEFRGRRATDRIPPPPALVPPHIRCLGTLEGDIEPTWVCMGHSERHGRKWHRGYGPSAEAAFLDWNAP